MMTKMKKIIIALTALLMLVACDIETSDNGNLDGFWQLKTVENIDTHEKTDRRADCCMWSVQGKMIQLSRTQGMGADYMFSFEHQYGTLRLYDARYLNRWESDPLLEELDGLPLYGITALEETFEVEQLTGSTMVLKSGSQRLYFRKY